MKKILYVTLLGIAMLTGSCSVQAQKKGEQLIQRYYLVKEALLAGNAPDAKNSASEFIKEVNMFDFKDISEEKQKTVQSFLTGLLKDAGEIAEAKDIAEQREFFSSFSNTMIDLAKEIKLSGNFIYINYCPMKKSYWLSAEQPVKNPYYGKAMLTCGKVTDAMK